MDYRVRNAEIFENTTTQCLTTEALRNAIRESIGKQKLYLQRDAYEEAERCRYEKPFSLVLSHKRSYEAAKPYAKAGKKVCVLNFASAVNPGGGVLYGAAAQEESLCRCSTLYFCLSDKSLHKDFYEAHREAGNYLNNDDIIYTPGIVVIKNDTDLPTSLYEDEWYTVDVLTCAAPDLKRYAGNLSNETLQELFEQRIRKIADVAAKHEAEVLILGAFGCGAFGNPPETAAEAFYNVLKNYLYAFQTVEFAIFDRGTPVNYNAFSRVLAPMQASLSTKAVIPEQDALSTKAAIPEQDALSTQASHSEQESPEEAEDAGDRAAAVPQMPAYAGSLELIKADITKLSCDCIVNAANEYLQAGGGVCGAIFKAAGYEALQKVCDKFGHCDTGNAVITPGFALPAQYIIHAVGPVYHDGKSGEEQLLYSAYMTSLEKAMAFGNHSIAFPLISSGIYGYPKKEAWEVAIRACEDFLAKNPSYNMTIYIAALSDEILAIGQGILDENKRRKEEEARRKAEELAELRRQEAERRATEKAKREAEAAARKAEAERRAAEIAEIRRRQEEKQMNVTENEKSEKTLMDLIRTRRSVRAYKPDMVPKELIDSVIEAGLYAASGMNRQTPVIIAITNKTLRDKIMVMNAKYMDKEDFDPFYGAPVILLVAAEKYPTATYDGSLTLGNMMLRAHELGLGSCWIHRAYQEIEDDFGKSLLSGLGLVGEYEGVGHLALGYPIDNEEKILPRKEGRVFYIQ